MRGLRNTERGTPICVNSARRRGVIAILAAVLMVFMVGVLAFSIDVGYLCMARSQAQHCADAAALAAALEMTSNENLKKEIGERIAAATQQAIECASLQDINRSVNPTSPDGAASVIESITFGRLENPYDPNEPISYVDPSNPNVVVVHVSCDPERGTGVPLFFARIFGLTTGRTSATAVAMFSAENTTGFTKDGDEPSSLAPFVVKQDDWINFLANGGPDNWTYDPNTKTVSPGPDGIPELKMYPEVEIDSPGNFGTVNIGESTANPAPKIWDQIVNGPSAEDLAYYDGILRLDPVTNTFELTGAANLELNADPGVTASIKHALGEVLGKPKTIMLYNNVEGSGNNAWFTISGFAGIRIMDFRMVGSTNNKYVLIQPAMVQDSTAVADADSQTSDFVGQPVHLVR